MRIVKEMNWTQAYAPSFQEREVLSVIGQGLHKVYGEPNASELPRRLRDLVQQLEDAERVQMRASER